MGKIRLCIDRRLAIGIAALPVVFRSPIVDLADRSQCFCAASLALRRLIVKSICNRQFIYQDKEKCMAKGKDTRKEEKKKPTRTLMEKRADKKAKKAGKGS